MTASMIAVEHVGKRYALRHRHDDAAYQTLRDALAGWARSPWRRLRPGARRHATTDDFWALRDVSFDVDAGDVVGVIGRNGAGKSTLLKILSRITEPTEGRVTLSGRAASLLEVGTGFHPELTGRENIYLNGAILGMTRAEIRRNFDSIVAFAEVAEFLDTPVKRYSSGMYVRLAFAVAAHLEPDILIVDEVLAVGDAEFQKKSLGKMHEVSRGGRTVLFVSHNMAAVQALCKSAIWLDRGRVAATGETSGVIAKYLHGIQAVERGLRGRMAIGRSLELRAFSVTPNPATSGACVQFSLTLGASDPVKVSEVAILIYSALEMRVAIIDLRSAALPARIGEGREWTVSGRVTRLNLVEGDYRLGLHVNSSDYVGDVADVVELAVLGRERAGEHAPYPAAHRGVVELEVEVEGA
jgi:lipopolysaccharide transport system ATP-binding protein